MYIEIRPKQAGEMSQLSRKHSKKTRRIVKSCIGPLNPKITPNRKLQLLFFRQIPKRQPTCSKLRILDFIFPFESRILNNKTDQEFPFAPLGELFNCKRISYCERDDVTNEFTWKLEELYYNLEQTWKGYENLTLLMHYLTKLNCIETIKLQAAIRNYVKYMDSTEKIKGIMMFDKGLADSYLMQISDS